jgi:hypothetical protein
MRSLIAPIAFLLLGIACGVFAVPRLNEVIYGNRCAVPFGLYSSVPPLQLPPGVMMPWSGTGYDPYPPWHWILWCCARSAPSLAASFVAVVISTLAYRPRSVGYAVTLGLLLTLTQGLTLAFIVLSSVKAFLDPYEARYSLPVVLSTAPLGAVWAALAWCVIPRRWRRPRSHSPQCDKCGYNLTGNVSGVCPECGTAVPAGASHGKQRSQGN